jgi:hypothetical protein
MSRTNYGEMEFYWKMKEHDNELGYSGEDELLFY